MLLKFFRRLISLPFFNRDEQPRSAWQVITWWEARRIFYNLLVGAVGIVTILLCLVSAAVGESFLGIPIGLPDPPIFAVVAVIVYGIMANVCYTGGWITEIIVKRVWEEQGQYFGKISFVLGVIFSIALTLLPGICIGSVVGIQLLAKFFK